MARLFECQTQKTKIMTYTHHYLIVAILHAGCYITFIINVFVGIHMSQAILLIEKFRQNTNYKIGNGNDNLLFLGIVKGQSETKLI